MTTQTVTDFQTSILHSISLGLSMVYFVERTHIVAAALVKAKQVQALLLKDKLGRGAGGENTKDLKTKRADPGESGTFLEAAGRTERGGAGAPASPPARGRSRGATRPRARAPFTTRARLGQNGPGAALASIRR